MAGYATLKAAINAVIKTNNNKEITGALMNGILNAMVNALGLGYQFRGVATAQTVPGTPDQPEFYIASPGTYSNFPSPVQTIPNGNIGLFIFDTSWVLYLVDVTIADGTVSYNMMNASVKASLDKADAAMPSTTQHNAIGGRDASECHPITSITGLRAELDAIKTGLFVLADTLPTASAETLGKIYLIPSAHSAQGNVKDEYITIATTAQGVTTYSWEQIGSTSIDLSAYRTAADQDEIDNNFPNKYNSESITGRWTFSYEVEFGSIIKVPDFLSIQGGGQLLGMVLNSKYELPDDGIPASDMASAVQTSLGKADSAVQPSALTAYSTTTEMNSAIAAHHDSTKQNTIDSSHKLSADLVDDSTTTNKFVTSAEKATWNGKQDALVFAAAADVTAYCETLFA